MGGAVWNVFLALVPVALAWMLVGVLRHGKTAGKWLLGLPLGAAWLFFLPNSPYLLTGWRHFFSRLEATDLLDRMQASRQDFLYFLLLFGAFIVYTALGPITFAAAIRPLHRWAKEARLPVWLMAVPFFSLVSLGVYLGLVLRFNTWDLLTHPTSIVASSLEALRRPFLMSMTGAFALALWLAYWIVDVWFDGLAGRFKGVGQPRASQARRAAKKPALST
jgi:uncharacterized membrane protein